MLILNGKYRKDCRRCKIKAWYIAIAATKGIQWIRQVTFFRLEQSTISFQRKPGAIGTVLTCLYPGYQ